MKEHFMKSSQGSVGGVSSHFFGEYSSSHYDDFGHNVGAWTPEMDQVHSEWCREHFINPSSMKSITQYIEVSLKTLYRSDFEPEWLKCQPLEPAWNRDQMISTQQNVFSSLYGKAQGKEMSTRTLVQLQGRAQSLGRSPVNSSNYACIHYLSGNCRFGDDCTNAHSLYAPRPPCRFFFSTRGCTNDNCLYAHTEEPADISEVSMTSPTHGKFNGGACAWFRQNSRSILLLGSCGIQHSLEIMGSPPGIVFNGSIVELIHFHENRNLSHHRVNAKVSKIVWNFPSAGSRASDEENESLFRGFFMSAAAYFQANVRSASDLEVGIALEGNQFSSYNLLAIAQHAGFCFEWFDSFDCAIFPNYMPRYPNNEEIQIEDAKFYVFRMKKNVLNNPKPKMMKLREGTQVGIELEMSTGWHVTRDYIEQELSRNGINIENHDGSWSEAKKTSLNWKIVGDSSILCNVSQPDCNRFELVSPILRSERGLLSAANVLQQLSNANVTVNRSMGFHVHFDVGRYTISELIKICQQFLKYEDAIDSMLPRSRRTGSTESNSFFKSNMKIAKENLGKDGEGVLNALGLCKNYNDLAEIMNPAVYPSRSCRYFKLNLQNLVKKRQSTVEFRQHSSTTNYEKVDAWVRFCVRFCENSASSEKPNMFIDRSKTADEKFDDLFKDIIRDSVLYAFYRKRKHLLSVDEEGDACCHGCVTGHQCSK